MTDYATLLRDHVTLNIRSIDRVLLQGYVPQLQTVGYVCRFLRWQRDFPIPSSAAFGRIGQQYVRAIHRFAEDHNIPRLKFEKGQDKEKTAFPLLQAAAKQGQDRVVLIGSAQEKAPSGNPGHAKVSIEFCCKATPPATYIHAPQTHERWGHARRNKNLTSS